MDERLTGDDPSPATARRAVFLRDPLGRGEARAAGVFVSFLLFYAGGSWIWRNRRLMAEGGDSWEHGEWLINNAAGPVRRGVSGEAVFALADFSGLDPLVIVEFLQSGLMAVLVLSVIFALFRLGFPARMTLIAASPGFLLAWQAEYGSSVKELLGFAAFLPLLLGALGTIRVGAALCAALMIFVVAVLFHEAMLLFLPHLLLCGHAIGQGAGRRSFPIFAVALVILGIALAAYTLIYPSVADPGPICARLLAEGVPERFCVKFGWQSQTLSDARDFTLGLDDVRWWPGVFLTPVLAYINLFAATAGTGRARAVVGLVIATFLVISPLYVIAVDYGRWLNIQVTLVTLTVLVLVAAGRLDEMHRPLSRAVFYPVLALSLLWRLSMKSGSIGAGVLEPLVKWALGMVRN